MISGAQKAYPVRKRKSVSAGGAQSNVGGVARTGTLATMIPVASVGRPPARLSKSQRLVKFGAQLRLVIYPIARIAPNPPQGSVSCCLEAFFVV